LINLLHFAEYFSFILVSNHHIRLISEGSGDTEDWSNESEN